jgi:S-methylmethionine-dependent homocysteine/selenocysteine methylase
MTHPAEAIGVAEAARQAGLPAVISFTVETDGRLPTGETLREAIEAVDAATGSYPAYYMVNCAHPTHFDHVLESGGDWRERIRGIRANASRMSHAELDEAEELDDGDPHELGRQYEQLRVSVPAITVLGGCCGTDLRHVQQIAAACVRPG